MHSDSKMTMRAMRALCPGTAAIYRLDVAHVAQHSRILNMRVELHSFGDISRREPSRDRIVLI